MFIYGRNPVLEALHAGRVERVFVANGVEVGFARQIEEAAARAQCELEWRPRIELDQAVGTTRHQGVVAEVFELNWSEPEDALKLASSRGEMPLLVLLDGITDPHNFGAIIRSAEALGAHGVIVEERRSAPLNGTVVKTSAGAATRLPLARVKNLPRFIEALKAQNIWVYGAAGEAARLMVELDYKRPLALVIGGEGTGLRRLVREHCDELVAIPMRGQTGSLNASVAAAILIHHAVQSR